MHHQKSVAELVELEAAARPDFQKALADFKAATKHYDTIKNDLQQAIKHILNEYCKIFGALDQRARQLNPKERPVIQQITHNSVDLSDFIDLFDEMNYISDVSDSSQDIHQSGFSVFYSQFYSDQLDPCDPDFYIAIPTCYLAVDGLRLMQEDADRISALIAQVEESRLTKKAQLQEARERAEFDRLRRKFS